MPPIWAAVRLTPCQTKPVGVHVVGAWVPARADEATAMIASAAAATARMIFFTNYLPRFQAIECDRPFQGSVPGPRLVR